MMGGFTFWALVSKCGKLVSTGFGFVSKTSKSAIRKYRNVSRMAVANATGFTYAQVEHYELGDCMPSTEFLFMFTQIFKCLINEIFKLSIKKF